MNDKIENVCHIEGMHSNVEKMSPWAYLMLEIWDK